MMGYERRTTAESVASDCRIRRRMRRKRGVARIGNRANGIVGCARHRIVSVTGIHGAPARCQPAAPDANGGESVVLDRQVKNTSGRIIYGTLVSHSAPVDLVEHVCAIGSAAVHTDSAGAVRDF